jgi:Zn-dependent M32 family carboxypeptidase
MAQPKPTKEGKAAKQLIESVNDFGLDLEYMGMYLAQLATPVLYNRLNTVLEKTRADLKERDKPMATEYTKKVEILSQIWLEYREDEDFKDFVEYNDVGLPLAFMIANGLVEATDEGENFLDETFTVLLAALTVTDKGYDSLEELLAEAE